MNEEMLESNILLLDKEMIIIINIIALEYILTEVTKFITLCYGK